MNTKVIGTADLIELNRRAVAAKRNRALADEVYDMLDPEGVHVVAMSMLHNDCEVRVKLLVKFTGHDEPVSGWIDMAIEDFNALKAVES